MMKKKNLQHPSHVSDDIINDKSNLKKKIMTQWKWSDTYYFPFIYCSIFLCVRHTKIIVILSILWFMETEIIMTKSQKVKNK